MSAVDQKCENITNKKVTSEHLIRITKYIKLIKNNMHITILDKKNYFR